MDTGEAERPWAVNATGLKMKWITTLEGLTMGWTLDAPEVRPIVELTMIVETRAVAA